MPGAEGEDEDEDEDADEDFTVHVSRLVSLVFVQ